MYQVAVVAVGMDSERSHVAGTGNVEEVYSPHARVAVQQYSVAAFLRIDVGKVVAFPLPVSLHCVVGEANVVVLVGIGDEVGVGVVVVGRVGDNMKPVGRRGVGGDSDDDQGNADEGDAVLDIPTRNAVGGG